MLMLLRSIMKNKFQIYAMIFLKKYLKSNRTSLYFYLNNCLFHSCSLEMYLQLRLQKNLYLLLPDIFDVGIVAGAGVDFKSGSTTYTIGARYTFGLTDLTDQANLRNRALQLFAGVAIPLTR